MKDNNFLSMFTDVVKNGVKNKTSLGIAVIGPIVVMIILGYIITMAGTADTLNIGVVDQDQGLRNISVASKITEELKNQDDVNVISINLDDVNNSFKDRTIDAVLIFPENFTVNVALNKSTEITLIAEGTDQTKTALVNKAVLTSAMEVASQSGSTAMSVEIKNETYYAHDLGFVDLFIYRVMALDTMLLSMIIALFTILDDKRGNRFKRMSSSPVKAAIAYTLGCSVFAAIIVPIVLSYVIYVMGVTIVGDVGSVALILLLMALLGVSLGVLAAALARTERQAFGLLALFAVLQVLFSGMLVPVARFDYYVQWISYILPLTYGLDALKSVMIRGFSLGDVSTDILAIFIIIIAAVILSAIGLRAGNNSTKQKVN